MLSIELIWLGEGGITVGVTLLLFGALSCRISLNISDNEGARPSSGSETSPFICTLISFFCPVCSSVSKQVLCIHHGLDSFLCEHYTLCKSLSTGLSQMYWNASTLQASWPLSRQERAGHAFCLHLHNIVFGPCCLLLQTKNALKVNFWWPIFFFSASLIKTHFSDLQWRSVAGKDKQWNRLKHAI